MKRVKKIVFVILSILLGLVLIFNVYNFISIKVLHKDLASVNGYAMLEVVSGSMEPTIHVGDIIIINTKDKDYNEKDIITFRGKEGEFVTHRIKSIDGNSMITQGDNNDSEDDPISTKSIVGKYVAKINGGGKILSSFKNPLTMVMIFVIGLLACILLSTDSDGKPLLDKEEQEFQEFLKSKNVSQKEEVKKVVPNKEDNSKKDTKKKANTTSKNDTENSESKKTSSTKNVKKNNKSNSTKKVDSKTSSAKATKKNDAKPASKKTSSVTKKTDAKTSSTKKDVSKKLETKKKTTVKKSTAKTASDKKIQTAKKTTSNKSSKK